MDNRKEYEGIVVDRADPSGIGRLRVFIFGLHDITGINFPIESLPWAFSTTSTLFTSVPEIGSVVKVKFKLDPNSGKNTFNPQYMEWSYVGAHYKLKNTKDLRNFGLTFDPTNQQFVNSSQFVSVEQENKNKNQINQLEEEKTALIEQLEVNQQELKNLEQDSSNVDTAQLDNISENLKKIESDYNTNLTQIDAKLKETSIQLFEDWPNYYNSNIKNIVGGLDIDEFRDSNLNSYNSYLDAYAKNGLSVLNNERKSLVSNYNREYDALIASQKNLTKSIEENTNKEENLNNSKKVIQSDNQSITAKINDIDKQLEHLKSSKPSGQNSLTSFEEAKKNDPRITRLDENSGKIYGYGSLVSTNEELIGNWNGSYCYIPGYAGQSGTSLSQLKTNRWITTESRLSPVDPFAAARANVTTNMASVNPAILESNENKIHSCDISYETKMKILTKRQSVMNAIKWLREQIMSLFSVESNSAVGQWVKAAVKQLTAILKATQKFLKFVNEVILEIAKITAQIRQLITWILSLPVRLLKFLQECLNHFFAAIGESLSTSINIGAVDNPLNVSFTEVTELITQAKNTIQTATETVEVSSIVYIEVKAISDTFEKV
jgi:hypothetical protein